MKSILLLGGTQFIGRNLVERLLETDQYELTLFNRQLTQSNLFPRVHKIKGNRETDDVKQIANKHWDYVIDLSCYYPDSLSRVLSYINNVDNYILISTCSVYDNENIHVQLRDESSKILSCNARQRVDRSTTSYGNRKAECERILQSSGLNHTILRPSLVYGAYDHTDRFYYWLYQVKYSNPLLLPDNGNRQFSLTYVNDLVDTIVRALTLNAQNKIYNVISLSLASILKIVDCASELLHKDVRKVNAKASFLKENNISQWTDMPLWIDGDYFTYSNQKLKADFGFESTTLKDSVKNTIEYYNKLGWKEPDYGMTEKTRQALIKKTNSQTTSS